MSPDTGEDPLGGPTNAELYTVVYTAVRDAIVDVLLTACILVMAGLFLYGGFLLLIEASMAAEYVWAVMLLAFGAFLAAGGLGYIEAEDLPLLGSDS